jgi:hypothetical protein
VSNLRPADYLMELVALVAANDGLVIRVESVEDESDESIDIHVNTISVLTKDLNSNKYSDLFRVLDLFFLFSKKYKYGTLLRLVNLVEVLISLLSFVFPFLILIAFLVSNLVLIQVIYFIFLFILTGCVLVFVVKYLMDKSIYRIASRWLDLSIQDPSEEFGELMRSYDQYIFTKNLLVFFLPIGVFISLFRFLRFS